MDKYLMGQEAMQRILEDTGEPLSQFNRKSYMRNFQELYQKYLPSFDAIEELYLTEENPDGVLRAMSAALVHEALSRVDACSSKNKKEKMQINLNLQLAAFIYPALKQHKGTCIEPLIERIQADWKEAFPKSNVRPVGVDVIDEGFHRKFCYITTAVCQTFHKADDCYELTLLRKFRDGYLASLSEGEELIRQYYDVAPTIVKHINNREDSGEIYQMIWDRYLSGCIDMIEAGEAKECTALYKEMVNDMRDAYFYVQ